MHYRFWLLAGFLFFPSLGYAQDDLETLRVQMQKQEHLIEEQQKQLLEMKQRLDKISIQKEEQIAESEAPTPKKVTKKKLDAPQQVATDRKEIAEEKIPEIIVLDDHAGVLLKRGKFILEPGLEYTNSSALRVDIQGFSIVPALNIGSFQISEVNRDTVTARLTGRLGVTNRLEVDASVPYLYRYDRTRARPIGVGASTDTLLEVDGADIGDIEFGAHYQLNEGKNDWPVFIANGRFKTVTGTGPFDVPIDPVTGLQAELPTGSGFYSLEPSITAIYPSDPVVFFGNLGYIFNFEDDAGTFGTIDPGDVISGSLGMSLALNDKASLSFSYSHQMMMETKQNGGTLPGSTILQAGSLNVGTSYRLSDDVGLNFIASGGLTEDAPDVRLLFKVPISFDLY